MRPFGGFDHDDFERAGSPQMIDRFTPEQFEVIRWAAQECEWQRSGEMSVVWMLEAWDYALCVSEQDLPESRCPLVQPTEDDILALGRLVEPIKNANGYRQMGVRVGRSVKGPWDQVPDEMRRLLSLTRPVLCCSPSEWFRQYEEVHPFVDGNGRTGNILWNWLSGTLAHPKMPPNLWGDPRRG